MDKNYWNNYYLQNLKKFPPSSFSKFVLDYLTPNMKLLDIGCGNGRDSIFFSENKIETIGIDFSETIIDFLTRTNKNKNLSFNQINLSKISYELKDIKVDAAYCRFILHAIDKTTEDRLIEWIENNTNSFLFIETRIFDPKQNEIEKNHYRRDILEENLVKKISKTSFEIDYIESSYEFSKYKSMYNVKDLTDDPLLCRIVAKK